MKGTFIYSGTIIFVSWREHLFRNSDWRGKHKEQRRGKHKEKITSFFEHLFENNYF